MHNNWVNQTAGSSVALIAASSVAAAGYPWRYASRINNILKLHEWIYKQSVIKLIILYFAAIIGCIFLGIIAFFFPVMPLSYLLNIEFSNLGPIATASWGLVVDIFVVTPLFIYFGVVKIIHANKQL